MRIILSCVFLSVCLSASGQKLQLKMRRAAALSGSEFAKSISDSTLLIKDRENRIFNEIKSGNIPAYLRKLVMMTDTITIAGKQNTISYYVLPDYIAIGSNEDFFYCPMTPMLAQRVADLTKCSMPTSAIVDMIYRKSKIKLLPLPIPPTKAMITVPVFIKHSEMVREQLRKFSSLHNEGALTSGNKKDLIISNKIYGEKTPRVVIFGWHMPDGKPIQPVYNKHTNTWADYSHGTRLVQNSVILNGKKSTYAKVLSDPLLSRFFSNEGVINIPVYPVFSEYVLPK